MNRRWRAVAEDPGIRQVFGLALDVPAIGTPGQLPVSADPRTDDVMSSHNSAMPEMPEVETIRRGLDATVRGARIESVAILWPPFVAATRAVLDTAVVGHRIGMIRRRGKALILDLGNDWHLLLHLKMTGQVVVHRRGRVVFFGGHPTANIVGPMPNSWTRAIFKLSADRTMFLNDQRKFARLRVVTTAELAADPFLSGMGPEVLDDDFSLAVLKQQLSRHRSAPVKAALLDQATVAGIGNIYADECLHLARIDPRQPTASLTDAQSRRLHHAIPVILRDAVDHLGTSYPSFIDDGHHRDSYLAHARLFGRQGQPCPVCGTRIERIRVAGRGTNYCPRCQRSEEPVPARAGHVGRGRKTHQE